MHSLSLSAADFQEILSSLLMAGLSYNDRMRHSQGASLDPHFIPHQTVLPKLDEHLATICTMFSVEQAILQEGVSLRSWANQLHDAWQKTDRQITFFTSGSTGAPKPNTHDIRWLELEIHALATLFKDRKQIVSFVPRHHIYGFLFSILLPKALACPVRWEVPLPTAGMIQSMKQGTLIIAFPLLWKKFSEMDAHFHAGLHGVTSTGPCPVEVINSLRSNGLDRMYEIYGSSETGGVGYRTSPGGQYTLLSHWTRTAKESTLLRSHPELGDEAAPLQDRLEWSSETEFVPTRRTDSAVQVAGINVYPTRVRDILTTHPAVKECAVRLMRPEEGNRLKACIVPALGCNIDDLENEIRRWAKERMSNYEMPGTWTFAKRLPANEMGKLKDW